MDKIKDYPLVVISKARCHYCLALQDFLTKFKKEYKWYKKEDFKPEELDEILQVTKTKTYPIVFVDNEYIGGYSDYMSYIRRLDRD